MVYPVKSANMTRARGKGEVRSFPTKCNLFYMYGDKYVLCEYMVEKDVQFPFPLLTVAFIYLYIDGKKIFPMKWPPTPCLIVLNDIYWFFYVNKYVSAQSN